MQQYLAADVRITPLNTAWRQNSEEADVVYHRLQEAAKP